MEEFETISEYYLHFALAFMLEGIIHIAKAAFRHHQRDSC